ncbi:MAG: hypothetical protein AB1775_08855 [Bacteroidota bacterium]
MDENVNHDHVVQKQLIKGQPKKKGFEYGGYNLAHKSCNSKFGDKSSRVESFGTKALELLRVLNDESIHRINKYDPEAEIFAISEDSLKNFSKSDLEFFSFHDLRKIDYEKLRSPKYLKHLAKTNPFEKPINIAITVLVKSAAAYFFSRFGFFPERWRIVTTTLWGDSSIDYDKILGMTKPFDTNLKLWHGEYNNGDRFAAYKQEKFQVWILFAKGNDLKNMYDLRDVLQKQWPGIGLYYFEADTLIKLIDYDWSNHSLNN